jgi:DNA-3-methyladenine glycosylase II
MVLGSIDSCLDDAGMKGKGRHNVQPIEPENIAMISSSDADPALVAPLAKLAAVDADIARELAACGLPTKRIIAPGFAGLVRIVISQQVSTASAAAILGRLEAAFPTFAPRPMLEGGFPALRAAGLSRPKIRYLLALAEAEEAGEIDFPALAELPDDEVLERLTRLPGIGPWTAEIYLLFGLKRPDVFPAGDRALQVAARNLKALPAPPDAVALRDLAETWRPQRSAAARFLWHFYRHAGI